MYSGLATSRKNPLSKEKNRTRENLIFAHYKLEVGGSFAKFESLLRFFVSILRNTLERTVRKAMVQSCQTRQFLVSCHITA